MRKKSLYFIIIALITVCAIAIGINVYLLSERAELSVDNTEISKNQDEENSEDKDENKEEDKYVLVDNDYVKIVSKGNSESSIGASTSLYVENKLDYKIVLTIDNLKVGTIPIGTVFEKSLFSKNKELVTVYWGKSVKVNTVKNVSGKLKITDNSGSILYDEKFNFK